MVVLVVAKQSVTIQMEKRCMNTHDVWLEGREIGMR